MPQQQAVETTTPAIATPPMQSLPVASSNDQALQQAEQAAAQQAQQKAADAAKKKEDCLAAGRTDCDNP